MKIEFHYTYILVALGFILTGYFHNLLIFTSIIIIHELGHYTMAKLNKLNVDKIIIYPYGGIVKMNNLINTKINKELSVASSGILFQTIYYILILNLHNKGLVREYIFNLFTMYHSSILIFNILPIHPLDGSKILNLLLSKIIPFHIANKLNIIISIVTLIIIISINYYEFNYTTFLVLGVIIDNIVKYQKNLKYIFNKFLLERYIYNLTYSKTRKIKRLSGMYKEKYHVIKENNIYITEKQALYRKFKRKT
jgi:stage IV sporulation protein FB